jgi:hypothetical protein
MSEKEMPFFIFSATVIYWISGGGVWAEGKSGEKVIFLKW